MDKNKKIYPPSWADRVLSWYCGADRFEEIQGDLHELFEYRIQEHTVGKAKLLYVWDVIRCFKPYAIGKRKSSINSIAMFKNYFLITARNLFRNKTYSAINIFGLAIGIVCFTFIFLYVSHELSYDQFHKRKEKIYTVPLTWHFGATTLPSARATSNI
ncbi:MAG: permease prefix domain 2-containing transporter, partial [Bacteroidota bacterium]